jgi:hypothetical protein
MRSKPYYLELIVELADPSTSPLLRNSQDGHAAPPGDAMAVMGFGGLGGRCPTACSHSGEPLIPALLTQC